MKLRVSIDRGTCIGSGQCVRLAKGAFALDEQGIAVVVDPDQTSEASLRLAERSCPTGAIMLEEDNASPGRGDDS